MVAVIFFLKGYDFKVEFLKYKNPQYILLMGERIKGWNKIQDVYFA